MTTTRQDRLWDLLTRDARWTTAAALADRLGVTTRSIRSYVTAINARTPGPDVIESGPLGYRVRPGARAMVRASDTGLPTDRVRRIALALVDGEIDVHDIAERLFVSSATVEADLTRVRSLVSAGGLTLERAGSRIWLAGTEAARRRVVGGLVHDGAPGGFDPEALCRALGWDDDPAAVAALKTGLSAELTRRGWYVNEYALAWVTAHVLIAADRTRKGHPLDGPIVDDDIAGLVAELANRHLAVTLAPGDATYLARLVRTRAVAPGADVPETARTHLDPSVEEAVRAVTAEAARTFGVDIATDEFIDRLALHVQNLVQRVDQATISRNPLTRSLKSSYPLIFDVAVFIASGLHQRLGIPVHDDETAFIAMHVGGQLQRARAGETPLTVTIVCPGYYEVHELLRASVERVLGSSVSVTAVATEVNPDWASIDTDLVLTTIDPPMASDRIVRIPPFLTEADDERLTMAAARARRGRRLARLKRELRRYLDEGAFVRGIDVSGGAEAVIRTLGGRLVDAGLIDDDYVVKTIERERMSSTAFTETLAVPHAMAMTATRTAMAIGIAEQSMPWGESRVQVIALVAFSETDRSAFQTVFDQFVGVFADPDNAQRLVRRGVDFAAFLDELAAIIDG